MAQEKQDKVSTKIDYVEVPGIVETFADSLQTMSFDGQTFRFEFCVTRMDEPKKNAGEITGKRLTACRLVLSPAAALQLSTKLGRMMGAMAQRTAAAQKAAAKAAPAAEAPAATLN